MSALHKAMPSRASWQPSKKTSISQRKRPWRPSIAPNPHFLHKKSIFYSISIGQFGQSWQVVSDMNNSGWNM